MSNKSKVLQIAGKFGSPYAVKYTEQELTDEQKTQARKNIYASEYVAVIDALFLMYETGIIEPVSDNAGVIYTDNNGLVYIL